MYLRGGGAALFHAQCARRTCAASFGKKADGDPEAWKITRWAADAFAYGSYSHIPFGASGDDYDALSEPVGDQLFFAGEATSRTYPATVHGAYLSGVREAQRF